MKHNSSLGVDFTNFNRRLPTNKLSGTFYTFSSQPSICCYRTVDNYLIRPKNKLPFLLTVPVKMKRSELLYLITISQKEKQKFLAKLPHNLKYLKLLLLTYIFCCLVPNEQQLLLLLLLFLENQNNKQHNSRSH